jgi:hypothetical protein
MLTHNIHLARINTLHVHKQIWKIVQSDLILVYRKKNKPLIGLGVHLISYP